MVIFGASGDLTHRKLMPALFHLHRDGLLDPGFAVLGVGRDEGSDESLRQDMKATLTQSAEVNGPGELDEDAWQAFAPRIGYVSGDLADPGLFERLEQRLAEVEGDRAEPGGRLFYLAVPPSVYETAIEGLASSGIAPRHESADERPWVRIIIEKPFGRSLDTARALNRVVKKRFAEHQIYRIDHYLGKETVQNLLVLRFANSIFEPVWNRTHIQHVQITAAEQVGVGHRAGYYEEAGVVRDMFQNHLMQLLSLTAMEPPSAFRADAVRDEKAKVLEAIRPVDAADPSAWAVRGQYGPGTVDGDAVPGYRHEDGVEPDSATPTWAAMRLMIDNWRWNGVPFFLRSGKRMARRDTEIAIRFRRPPHLVFPDAEDGMALNTLVIQVQPDDGISLCFNLKVPGAGLHMTSATMNFTYAEAFGAAEHSAYETLLLDAMVGDATLFTRDDGVEEAWRVVDPVIQAWASERPTDFPNYAAGSEGPAAGDELLKRAGAHWRALGQQGR